MTDKDIKYEPLPAYEQVESSPQYPREKNEQAMGRRSGSQRFIRIIFLAFAVTLLIKGLIASFHHCFRLPTHIHHPHQPFRWEAEDDGIVGGKTDNSKVALEAHIMSKCPDAKYCLQNLVVPAMEKIHDKVNFTLSFIGQLDPNSDAVTYPKIHLGYANCMISDYKSIPERDLVEGCAMEHGIDFTKINKCISDDGGEGVGLLRDSVARSSDNNVTKSCTVRVNGEIRCIRDGGEWKDCNNGSSVDDLVRDIEDAYNSSTA